MTDPAASVSPSPGSGAAGPHPSLAAPAEEDFRPGHSSLEDRAAIAICHDLAGRLFPWDITRALELALLKTFCVPSISGLLATTGEFSQRPRKRYDDTGLMVAELLRHGPDSSAGAAVIHRLNRIHAAYPIRAEDYRYVLSTFVCEPIRWLARYGWRPLWPEEQKALHRFWLLVGQRMGIPGIPADLPSLLAFNQAFEAQALQPAPSNRLVADATIRMLLAGLRMRSRLAAVSQSLRPPQDQRFYSQRPTPSYGAGFELSQLGPPHRLAELNRPRWSGRQRRIGLTGGIASGKSSVGRLLASRGLPLLDADVYAREALAPGTAASRAVLARYGPAVLARPAAADAIAQAANAQATPADAAGSATAVPAADPTAALDRAALGRIVFADPAERRWLEQLVHPLVRQRFAAEFARLAAEPALVLVIPLLFEVGLEELCGEVWLVDCDETQQLQRLMERDRLSEAEARARLAAQWPLARKRDLAEVLIDNRGAPAALEPQVEAALWRNAASPSS